MPTPPPILCYVTDQNSLPASENLSAAQLLDRIRDAITAGVNWIQIREKDLPTRALLGLAQSAIQASEALNPIRPDRGGESNPTKVIVNDRLDIAVAVAAAGVHLGSKSAPVREAVSWCRRGNAPSGFLIGASCHTVGEVCEAENAGVSYVIFGPVFDTPSKLAFGPPAGIVQLSAVCAAVRIPVLAIGGIDGQNAGECIRSGAAGIAAIRMFQDAGAAPEMKSTVESLRKNLQNSSTKH